MTRAAAGTALVVRPDDDDVAAIVALNNRFAPEGLTLPRTPAFVQAHLDDFRIVRGARGDVVGQVALDEYSPSLAELVSLAVAPEAQGHGLGRALIEAAVQLAARRGYPRLIAVSLADTLFLRSGFTQSNLDDYPEKTWRYQGVSRSELSIGRKHLFVRELSRPVSPHP
ncbi:MAG: GNAT family N-acetyltransferase [Gemmatimonadaceae bacterium]|jgi:amino-acid N-acetyltransferase|nr:GNAT family N-acetyltransferase [Gemmatimonadaceae bacterium]